MLSCEYITHTVRADSYSPTVINDVQRSCFTGTERVSFLDSERG